MGSKTTTRGASKDADPECAAYQSNLDKRRADLLQDCLACFSLAQLCNGVAAMFMSLVGCSLGSREFPGGMPFFLWSIARFMGLCIVGFTSYKAFGRRSAEWGPRQERLARVALCLQLTWFGTELVLGSCAVTLAPLVVGESSPYGVPASAIWKVYAAAGLITCGACIAFNAQMRQRALMAGTNGGEGAEQLRIPLLKASYSGEDNFGHGKSQDGEVPMGYPYSYSPARKGCCGACGAPAEDPTAPLAGRL